MSSDPDTCEHCNEPITYWKTLDDKIFFRCKNECHDNEESDY